MAGKKKKQKNTNNIASNKKATHDYFVEQRFEAGLVLEGWEVKSIRDGRVQLKEAYIVLRNGEAWLSGAHISPLLSASTHIDPQQTRLRKLLLNRRELINLVALVERKGYTIVPLSMYWVKNRVKLEIGAAKGKKLHDKRASSKDKDWQREKQRILKHL
ncbi:MAG: SsrA-binding protein [Piscirickettsiaceae bacterium]|nr:MAG: SsrA-binding protein [Piscirickettsiaceae bacterium]PCI68066.1 MAG: SsrA-binding protein [Piscirickettsiaceae bacterium]